MRMDFRDNEVMRKKQYWVFGINLGILSRDMDLGFKFKGIENSFKSSCLFLS